MPPFDPPPCEVSAATESALELASLLALVAHKAATDLGHERLRALRPLGEAELRGRRRRYQEAERLLAARPLVPASDRPLQPILEDLVRGGRELGGRELVTIGDVLRWSDEACERVRDADPACDELRARVAEVPSAAELRRLIGRTFDRRGEIREDATPRLAALRGRIRGTRDRLYGELRTHLEAEREHLSEETIPLRGGRLVLVLQAGARGKVPGLVHGRSASGRSFYFEPLAAVELNNDLQQSVEEEEQEKRRILAELVDRLRAELDTVRAHFDLVAELDVLQASIRFAQDADAHLADLAAPGNGPELVLHEARHPLLDPRLADLRREALGQPGHEGTIVPLELTLDADRRVLVVTGPNAGGKTVALKTAGLLGLAHQCGLPIPARRGSRLPVLHALVATVGDDQDLLADRSTFSGRLLRLREAWEAAGPDSLILLDELGSGTDPEEGAALSVALLEALLKRRALVVITTHLTQLAAAALEAEGAVCAAMELDADTGQPTYRLLPGPPGGSEALALARRLGLPAAWLDRAEALLGSEHRDLRKLIAEVDRVRQELVSREERLAVEVADAERLRQRLAREEEALVAERKRVGETLRTELRRFQEETRRKLHEELDRLRRDFEEGRRKNLAAAAAERLFAAAPQLGAEHEEEEGEVRLGGRVRHRAFGWEGTLAQLDRGRAQVEVGGKVFNCRADELVGRGGGEAPAAAPERRPYRGRQAAESLETEPAPREINLIGRRVEPALEALDRFLDQALLAAHGQVRVVHGHGSGQLRRAVREHLRGHPAVASQKAGSPEEGGDGATVVDLRA